MTEQRICIKEGVIVVRRPGLHGTRFTAAKTERIIREEKDERHARAQIRSSRQQRLADSKLDTEIIKAESVINLRDSLLRELAIYENNSLEASADMNVDTIERIKKTLEKTKLEIVEALKTLI